MKSWGAPWKKMNGWPRTLGSVPPVPRPGLFCSSTSKALEVSVLLPYVKRGALAHPWVCSWLWWDFLPSARSRATNSSQKSLNKLFPEWICFHLNLCFSDCVQHSLDCSRRECLVGCVQFSSVAQSCLTLCDPMNRSTSGLPVYHQLPEFTQTHVHWVGDAI